MTMSEAIYDEKIAPLLMQAGKLCEEHGLAMVAVVEYEPGKRGETRMLPDGSGLAMKMLSMLAMAGENVDGYMIGLTRYAKKHGIDTSGSIFLSRFGTKEQQ
jgi:hypothetical protein